MQENRYISEGKELIQFILDKTGLLLSQLHRNRDSILKKTGISKYVMSQPRGLHCSVRTLHSRLENQ